MMSSFGLAAGPRRLACPHWGALVPATIFGAALVRAAAVATAFVEGLAAADGGAGGAGFPCRKARADQAGRDKKVAANAPHLVLRRQNIAATITGDMAAKPEKA
jgi:hypothetical protein